MKKPNLKDSNFKVYLISKTVPVIPQFEHFGAGGISYLNAHRCYSEELSIVENPPKYLPKTEEEAIEWLKKEILKPGHFSVCESFGMQFEIVGFNHRTISQALRHRVGCSYSVQSNRYTGSRIIKLVKHFNRLTLEEKSYLDQGQIISSNVQTFVDHLEQVFYSRPAGTYTNRDSRGKSSQFEITEKQRLLDLMSDFNTAEEYYDRVVYQNYSRETAADRLAQSFRQSYMGSFNMRSLFGFWDRRLLKDSQIEVQYLAYLLFEEFKLIAPEIAQWYWDNRATKNKLAP